MNMGGYYTEDISARARIITLRYFEEDPNSRKFPRPDLHGWIIDNRSNLLSAFAGLIAHWDSKGRPEGLTPFTSFPKWAQIVGGIMTCCEFGDPCASQRGQTLTSSTENDDMQKLFELAFERHPDQLIKREELYAIILDPANEGLFHFVTDNEKSWKTGLGITLKANRNCIKGDIQLQIQNDGKKRPDFKFTKNICHTDSEVTHAVFQKECLPCLRCPPSNTLGGISQQLYTASNVIEGVEKVDKVPMVDSFSNGLLPAGKASTGIKSSSERESLSCTDYSKVQIPKAVIPGCPKTSTSKVSDGPQCIPPVQTKKSHVGK
jgi:hypothetical protein